MAIAQVGTELAEFLGAGGGTSSNKDSTGANLILINVNYFSGSGGTIVLSDNKGNTYVPLTARENATASQQYYCLSPTSVGSGHNWTVVKGGIPDPFPSIYVYLWSGVVSFQAQSGTTRGGVPGTTLQPGSITPNTNGALIFSGCCASGSASGISVDSGLTANTSLATNQGTAFKIQGTAAAINPTWTWTNNAEGGVTMSVFLETGADQSVTGGTISSGSSLTAPTVDQNLLVTGGTISSTTTLYAPSVTEVIVNGTIASTLVLYAPSISAISGFNVLSIWP